MKITLSPQRGLPGQPETALHVSGDTVTVDGAAHDFSAVPEGGAQDAPDAPFEGAITREGGMIHATVRVILGDDAASAQPTDPAHWIVEVTDGPVTIPALRQGQTGS